MALQLGALRDALIDAGAKPEKADKAAEEMAGYETKLAGIETRLAVLTWMGTANLALTLLILSGLLAIWTKLGEVSGQLAQLARAVP